MNRLHIATLALLGLAVGLFIVAPLPAAPAPEKGQAVDVAICLDVSGSMGGLIESAKLKLWDIVNDLGRAKPAPRLRVALYSYGGGGYAANAGWVHKEIDLTEDLDAVYQKLNVLRASGSKEYVARVCENALTQQQWSEEKNALRVIFVCGNESARQDPTITLEHVATQGKKQDVVINTIYCGPKKVSGVDTWVAFAKLTGGQHNNIDHENATVVVATPYDKEIAKLSAQLNTTYLAYGKKGKEAAANQARQDANAARLKPGVAAARGVTKAGKLYNTAAWDLVDRLERDPKFDISKIPVKDLPKEMQKMKPKERVAHIKKMLEKRKELRQQINKLALKQRDFIQKEREKQGAQASQAFDEALRKTLRKQAGSKGIEIPKK
jgi:hypothetical protein